VKNSRAYPCGVPALAVSGANIEGTAVIKRQLTKHRFTAAVPLYQRGQGVGLAADAEAEPLDAERSRVAVWLEGPIPPNAGTPAVATTEVIKMAQENRSFTPEMVVIPAGGKVSFPNLDPILHNIVSLSKAKAFDLGKHRKGETRKVTSPEPGMSPWSPVLSRSAMERKGTRQIGTSVLAESQAARIIHHPVASLANV